MICSECQTSNADDARFCENCGHALEHMCPRCGKPNSPSAKFCRNCGQRLSDAQAIAQTQAPSPAGDTATPRPLVSELQRPPDAGSVHAERRVVSVLFCDVKGSTAMAEKLDPEDWAEIMNDAFQYLIAPVYRYEGTVARLMGDALLAFFGAPVAHEDDPQRAVLAALDIVSGIGPFRERIRRERGLDFNVRVGINTGLVVVGEVGSDLKVEYTAMGDAVNLAARMEQTAQPGTVQVSGNTHKLIAPFFDVEPLGGIEVKGKAEQVPAYRVVRAKASPGRLRGIEGLDAPMIGRDKQLATLQHALRELDTGRGQIVCLIGEAGLGKSRLILEARQWSAQAEGTAPLWSESRAVSYGTAQPYLQFQQHLRNLTGAGDADGAKVPPERLMGVLEHLPEDERANARRVYALLLAEDYGGAAQDARLEGEAYKRQLFDAMLQFLRALAAARPVVLVFDDLHWADAASVELLRYLLPLCDEAPIILLCAFRPDRQSPGWSVRAVAEAEYPHRYTEIALGPLTSDEGNALIEHLLTVSDLPARLRGRILEKSEGNPFFVEEVVRTLLDSGVVKRDQAGTRWHVVGDFDDIALPDNLQALLIARMDRLDERARSALQLAAVIGRSFYYRVLKSIADQALQLDQQLRVLQKVELIREQKRIPELEFAFRHALTQEAAYQSILLKRRREFHRKVGEALEVLFADHLEEHYAVLAHHFDEANDPRAQRYHTLSGDAAFRIYALNEALTHYRRALVFARRTPGEQRAAIRFLWLRAGRISELLADFREAYATYEEMERFAQDQNEPELHIDSLVARAVLHATLTPLNDPERAIILCEQALALAHALDDRAAESRIDWALMMAHTTAGRNAQGLIHGERSLVIARELNLREQIAQTLNDMYYAYGLTGTDSALALVGEASDLWRELGNMPMLLDSLTSSATGYLLRGDFTRSLELAGESMQLSRQTANVWGEAYAGVILGYAFREVNAVAQALQTWTDALRDAMRINHVGTLVGVAAELGLLHARLGAFERAAQLTKRALEAADAHLRGWRPWAVAAMIQVSILSGDIGSAEAQLALGCRADEIKPEYAMPTTTVLSALAELALARRDPVEAVRLADDFRSYVESREIAIRRPDALYTQARALQLAGRSEEACAALRDAIASADQIGLRRDLWLMLAELAGLESQRGNASAAVALSQRARELVLDVSRQLAASALPELQTSFESLPRVRALLEAEPR